MKASELNKRIVIQKYNTYTNDNGFDVEDWEPYKTVWGKKNNLFGKEFWAAKAVQSENNVEFIIRYSKDLEPVFEKDGTKIFRIYYKNTPYNIIYLDNVREENKWIKIKAESV